MIRPTVGTVAVEQWEELFAAIHARLERAVTTGDFTPVLEPGVLEEARRLAELASSDRANMEIAHIGGWLHWARYHGAADDRDLNTAIDAFTRCFIAGVDDVPDELLPVLAKQAVPVGNARIRELLQGTAERRPGPASRRACPPQQVSSYAVPVGWLPAGRRLRECAVQPVTERNHHDGG